MNNLDRSMVRTSDFKSENQGSIPCLGVFYNFIINPSTIIKYPCFKERPSPLSPSQPLSSSPPPSTPTPNKEKSGPGDSDATENSDSAHSPTSVSLNSSKTTNS